MLILNDHSPIILILLDEFNLDQSLIIVYRTIAYVDAQNIISIIRGSCKEENM